MGFCGLKIQFVGITRIQYKSLRHLSKALIFFGCGGRI
ncbi:hypothetical protein DEHRE_02435 [Dehalobacter restrictus DSM 9455]|uniref:Transposase n=1 Tax=Dehalobacter restrictus (strain DSM 9455 / PER-K23) TaxID=871738 RepID=A0ABM5P976_DEHRP|nr:hypothetical protein DEHRE_02435 [Dehalobacter restrictus DSM 9455]